MKVTVMTATEKPIDVISLAAGSSTRKDDVKYKRVERCILDGHSVSEFADVTFKIEGISRACLAQLTRHRMASYCVESQRYNKYNFDGEDWYVVPPYIQESENLLNCYQTSMTYAALQYKAMLDDEVKAEDARFVLPEATKTNLHMKINARALFNFFEQRRNPHAQWEIHNLADEMIKSLREYNEQWNQMMDIYLEYEKRSQ